MTNTTPAAAPAFDLTKLTRPVVAHYLTGELIRRDDHKAMSIIGVGEPLRCSRNCGTDLLNVMWANGSGDPYTSWSHVDGREECGEFVWPMTQCPKCKTYESLTTDQLAYGDLTRCTVTGCGYDSYYPIGD